MTHTPATAPARTIVLSDAHGNPGVIEAVLEASAYRQGEDRLVFAGDFLDRGSRAGECLALLDEAGAEMLWGNHDIAVLLGLAIFPQNPESCRFRPKLYERFLAGEWRLVTAAGDEGSEALVSHAGISPAYLPEWVACGMRPAALAELVNDEFRREVEAWLGGDGPQNWDEVPRVLGDLGPLWVRPTERGRTGCLRGVRQVFGHTPLSARGAFRLAKSGVYCVDPGVANLADPDGRVEWRYAAIEGGRVELVFEREVSLMAS